MRKWSVTGILILNLFILSRCSPVPGVTPAVSSTPEAPLSSPTWAPVEPSSTPTNTPEISPPLPKTSGDSPIVCAPLRGFQLAQLKDIISTPYEEPPLGQDSGHHGVDFGFYRYGIFETMEGLPVQSILTGTVASVVEDRPPYGNMVLIETPLDQIPQPWQQYLQTLPVPEYIQPDGRLACPDMERAATESINQLSIYMLYAHLATPPDFEIGQNITCADQIGIVGNTGYSGNTHLHLEARLGPSGIKFSQMAHYTNNATPEEMNTYCTWRISGLFRLMNPIDLLTLDID